MIQLFICDVMSIKVFGIGNEKIAERYLLDGMSENILLAIVNKQVVITMLKCVYDVSIIA